MKQIFLLATVLLCNLAIGKGKPNILSRPEQSPNIINQLLGNSNGGPSIVVEVDDVTNAAAVKLINLPLTRKRSNIPETVQKNIPIPSDTDNISSASHSIPDIPKSRPTRDLDFKIYDRVIIQKVIDLLNRTDPARAAIMRLNINRVVLEVDIEDDDDYAERLNLLNLAKQFGFSRRRRSLAKDKENREKSKEVTDKKQKVEKDQENEQKQEKEEKSKNKKDIREGRASKKTKKEEQTKTETEEELENEKEKESKVIKQTEKTKGNDQEKKEKINKRNEQEKTKDNEKVSEKEPILEQSANIHVLSNAQ